MKTNGRVWIAGAVAGALLLGILAAGCKTGGGSKKDEAATPAMMAQFRPATPLSRLHFGTGSYSNLFAPSSYAVWADQSVNTLRMSAAQEAGETLEPELAAEAEKIAQDYLIIECHLDSEFGDMSIAYDAVGLRGVDVYLETPDGKKVPPIQLSIGSHAAEEQRDALKLFGRTNLAIFARRDLWLNAPIAAEGLPSVRLVFEAQNSTFYFEWPASPPGQMAWVPAEAEKSEVLKTGFREFHQRVRTLAHIFD
ncbi:MAG: hypothetical protein QG656_1447 [Candidatus Hydrogenedentes bacterium]|nr:hypothetical protein [Candidatus Hydrogenedentota bacterium]